MEQYYNYIAQSQTTGSSTFETLFWIASCVGMYKMFEKAGEKGWKAFIPFYNMYNQCRIVMGDTRWFTYYLITFFALILVPILGLIAFLYVNYQICKATAKAYGMPDPYAWGFLLLSPVFNCMAGFGEASYYGPMGIDDRRSSQARGAKTVDFDVVKNPPVQEVKQAKDVVVEKVENEGDTVDFTFDEPTE